MPSFRGRQKSRTAFGSARLLFLKVYSRSSPRFFPGSKFTYSIHRYAFSRLRSICRGNNPYDKYGTYKYGVIVPGECRILISCNMTVQSTAACDNVAKE